MRTIIGKLVIDLAPVQSLQLEIKDGEVATLGKLLERDADQTPEDTVHAFGRSGRLFFKKAANGEDPAREYIIPHDYLIMKKAHYCFMATDNDTFGVVDLCLEKDNNYIILRKSQTNPDVIVLDLQRDLILNFESILEYDIFITKLAPEEVASLPVPSWENGSYQFNESEFEPVGTDTKA